MLKKVKKVLIIFLIIMIVILVAMLFLWYQNLKEEERRNAIQTEISKNTIDEIPSEYKKMIFEVTDDGVPIFKEIVYDGMTYDELVKKLNKSLTSNLTGMGEVYAKACIETGVDPYLAVAISLYETGCKWGCSTLVRQCNNVGGIKGNPGCNGGSFKKYSSLEEGITSFVNLIATSYYGKGLTTAELMAYKYAGGSTTWAGKVNNYIALIKSK